MIDKIKGLMRVPDHIRNIGIVAHIDHGKTTLSDNLLAGAGMISEELAGTQLFLDFDELEQARGITIDAANVSMVHEYEGEEYLINLIDTPGHVDFGGDVTRAMRAVDGVVIVVCAVEGVMPQTETVLRQALKERVKPILFINKVDRLIKELKLTPEQIQSRFLEIISEVNSLIRTMAPDDKKDEWLVRVDDGSVAFGSAYQKWAVSAPYIQKGAISFKEIIDHVKEGNLKELHRKASLHNVLLDMIIRHLPPPITAQPLRIPKIWPGDNNSDIFKAMQNCDPNSPLAMMITSITIDPHAGEVATGRVFSGSIKKGQEVYMVNAVRSSRVQQVGVYMGPERVNVEEVPAGNIAAIVGLPDVRAGETLCDPDYRIEGFEEIVHISEPVVTVAVEAKDMKNLPKLIEVLRQVEKEDPTIKVEINEETGEHLISGMGELHLDVTTYRITRDKGIELEVSEPIVVYRETVEGVSPIIEGKSPNKHNKLYFVVEPLEKEVYNALVGGEISSGRVKSPKELRATLVELGMNREEARNVVDIYRNNILLDMTKGIQYLNEVMELVVEAFHEAMDGGPVSREKVAGVKVKLVDASLHEDAVHRGPAQIIPAVRSAILAGMLKAKDILLEPKQYLFIHVPQEYLGAVTREVQSRRGQILDIRQEKDMVILKAKIPVSEMFGFAGDIRSATEGRVLWSTEFAGFEKLPEELQESVIQEIRNRKGLKPEPPTPESLLS